MDNSNLAFELPIGAKIGEVVVRNVELLPVNGVAEKIVVKRLADRPHTWMHRIMSVTIGKLGTRSIAGPVRKGIIDTGDITPDPVLLQLPLNDVSTLLVEIHRRVWTSKADDQKYLCEHCGNEGTKNVDLNLIKYSEEDLDIMESEEKRESFRELVCELPDGFEFESPKSGTGEGYADPEFHGQRVTKLKFRIPLLRDAINNEKDYKDNVVFMRKLAYDCLIDCAVEKDGADLWYGSDTWKKYYRYRLFDYMLMRNDLKAVRKKISEGFPQLSFYYEAPCDSCGRDTPVTVNPENFFSE